MPKDFSRNPGLVDSSSRSSKRGSPMAVALIGESSSCSSKYSSTSALSLLSGVDFGTVLQALVARFRIAGERLGDVTGGAVLKHSKDFNLVRECVLSSGLDPATPGIDMQRACGTGLDAAISIAMKIALGQIGH